jgi:hypothetical protein
MDEVLHRHHKTSQIFFVLGTCFPLHVHHTINVFPVGFTIAALKSNEGQCLVAIGLADWTRDVGKFVRMMYLEHISTA